MLVVDGFEAVEVNQHPSQGLLTTLCLGHGQMRSVVQQQTVGQLRQRVKVGNSFQLGFMLLDGGDVDTGADIAQEGIFFGHRSAARCGRSASSTHRHNGAAGSQCQSECQWGWTASARAVQTQIGGRVARGRIKNGSAPDVPALVSFPDDLANPSPSQGLAVSFWRPAPGCR